MKKLCKICECEFNTDNYSRLYCYTCSGDSTRRDNETRKHQKTVLRRSMKLQAIKILGNKCCKCGYDRCVDALEFHHKNPKEKDFKLGSGNTLSWDEYKKYFFNFNPYLPKHILFYHMSKLIKSLLFCFFMIH